MKRLFLVLAIVGLVVASITLLPVGEWSARVATWVRGAGVVGVVGFVGLYVLASVLLLPGSALTLAAGFAYGVVGGVLVVAPAATLAATVAFLIARGLGQERIRRRVEADARLTRVLAAARARGFRLIALLRLSPLIPFNLLNYGLGLSGVSLRAYVTASFLGMLPGTILYVYLGSLVTSTGQLGAGSAGGGGWKTAMYVVGLVASVAVAVMVGRLARRALAEELATTPAPEPTIGAAS